MTTAIPVAGVNELVLETADLEASERFYTRVLGFPVIGRWEGPEWAGREAVWVLGGSTRIGLWNRCSASPGDGPESTSTTRSPS